MVWYEIYTCTDTKIGEATTSSQAARAFQSRGEVESVGAIFPNGAKFFLFEKDFGRLYTGAAKDTIHDWGEIFGAAMDGSKDGSVPLRKLNLSSCLRI